LVVWRSGYGGVKRRGRALVGVRLRTSSNTFFLFVWHGLG
jgi:hypothetical protein